MAMAFITISYISYGFCVSDSLSHIHIWYNDCADEKRKAPKERVQISIFVVGYNNKEHPQTKTIARLPLRPATGRKPLLFWNAS